MDPFGPLLVGFLSLLLLPALGVAGMVRQRVTPWLGAAVFGWLLFGGWALSAERSFGLPPERFLRLWLAGLVLGGGLLFVARLREKRRTWRWIRAAMALATLAVFARALVAYLNTYA